MGSFKKVFFLPFFLFAFCGNLFSQALNPVSWAFSYKDIDENTLELSCKVTVSEGWHIYSQLQSGDGPLPTVFHFEASPEFDLAGKVNEPDPERMYSDVFGTDVIMFSKEAVFTQKIKRNTKKPFIIMGEVECMSCNNSQCLPPKTVKINVEVKPFK